MASERHVLCCTLCGLPLGKDRPWIVLNRYVVGDGVVRQYVNWLDDDGEDVWDVHAGVVGGWQLCLDPCLRTWIDGRLMDANLTLRQQQGGG